LKEDEATIGIAFRIVAEIGVEVFDFHPRSADDCARRVEHSALNSAGGAVRLSQCLRGERQHDRKAEHYCPLYFVHLQPPQLIIGKIRLMPLPTLQNPKGEVKFMEG
jgi:hypothetical protein